MGKKKCSIFQETKDFGVVEVSVIETHQTHKSIDENGNVVEVTTETLSTILRKEGNKPKESTGIKALSITALGILGALIGALSDLPGAIAFVEKTLHWI